MTYTLCNADIDAASEEVSSFFRKLGTEPKKIVPIRLGLEDALLRYQEKFGTDQAFTLKCGKFLGKAKVTISLRGEMYDPFNPIGDTAESSNRFMRQALSAMGDLPVWRYSLGVNSVTFGLDKTSVPDWVHLIVAVASALALGVILNLSPDDVREFFAVSVLEPVLSTFMGFLGAMAGPMIFLEIVWGIYSIGDAATFSVLGKRLVGRYLIYIVGFTAVLGAAMLPLFNLSWGETGSNLDYSPLYQMVLDIIPSNLFEPFLTGNTLQILFVAVIVGLAMLFVAEKTSTVAIFVEQIDIIVQIIMNVISKLVPLFVFGSLLDMFISDQLAQIAASYKLLLVNVVGSGVILFVTIALACIFTKTNFGTFFRKMLPTFIIGLTTASSSAAFATNRKTCSDEYGIRDNLSDFGVPFGQVIYKPTVSLLYFSAAICVSEMFDVSTSITWIITVLIMAVILSVATAPLPGSALASLAMMFAQLGIPSEGVAVVMALNIVLDFLETPIDLVGGQCQLVLAARNFKMIDYDILHK